MKNCLFSRLARGCAAALLALSLPSCLEMDGPLEGGGLVAADGAVEFTLVDAQMSESGARSILTDPDIETRKTCVSLGVYTSGVLYAKAHYTSSLTALPMTLDKNRTYHVYALVNMGDMRAAFPDSESAIENVSYTIPSYTSGSTSVASRGIPMAGSEEVNIGTSVSGTVPLTVVRLLSKVSVTLNAQWAGATVTSVCVKGLNASLRPFGVSAAGGASDILPDLEIESGGTSSSLSAVFYVPENMQGSISGIASSVYKNPDLNASVSAVSDRLTYLETSVSVKGEYMGTMTYRSYLGSNATTNFDIERNRRYSWTVSYAQDGMQYDDWKRDNGVHDNRYVTWENYTLLDGKKVYAADPGSSVLAYPDYHYTVDGITTHITGRKDVDWTCTQAPGSGITYGTYTPGGGSSDESVSYSFSHAAAPGDYPIQVACTSGNTDADVAYLRVNDRRYLRWNDMSSRMSYWPVVKSYEYSEDRIDIYVLDNTYYGGAISSYSPFNFVFGSEQGDYYIAGTHYTALALGNYFSIDYSSLSSTWSLSPSSADSESVSSGAWFRFSGSSRLRTGTYPITVSYLDGSHTITAYIHVVLENGYRLYLSPSSATIDGGDTQQLRAEVYRIVDGVKGEMVADVTSSANYTLSSNSQYGSISSSGLFTGINSTDAYKSVTVNATCTYDGQTLSTQTHGSCSIRVNGIRETLTVTPASSTIYVGDGVDLSATYRKYRNGSLVTTQDNVPCTWSVSSSQPSGCVSVNASTGRVQALASGTATVHAAATVGGHLVESATDASVTVEGETYIHRYEMELSDGTTPAEATVAVGSSQQFYVRQYTDTYRNGVIYNVDAVGARLSQYVGTWASGNSAVATVSYGHAIGISAGSAAVNWTASGESGVTCSGSVSVVDYPTKYRLEISPASATKSFGESQVYVVYRYTDIYELDGVTLRSLGTDPVQMNNTDFAWSSSNTSVASVVDGTATVSGAGTTTITATLHSNVAEYAKYTNKTVSASLTGNNVDTFELVVSPASTTANVGQTVSLPVTFTATYYVITNGVRDSGTDVSSQCTWTKVTGSPYVTLSGMDVSCSAQAFTSVYAEFVAHYAGLVSNNVRVNFNPVVTHTYSLAVSPSSASVNIGGQVSFTATLTDRTYINGILQSESVSDVTTACSWQSSSTSVATVNASGVATGVSSGTVTITATHSATSKTAQATLAVNTQTYELVVSPASTTVNVGQTVSLPSAFTVTYYVLTNGVRDSGINVTSQCTWTKSAGSSYVTLSGTGVSCSSQATSSVYGDFAAHYSGIASNNVRVNFNPVVSHSYSLDITPSSASMYVGEQVGFRAILTDVTFINGVQQSSTQTDVTSSASWYKSSNICSVVTPTSTYYTLRGESEGTLTLYARYVIPGMGQIVQSDNATVTVMNLVTYRLFISPASARLLAGYSRSYTVTRRTYVNGIAVGGSDVTVDNSQFDWSVSGASVASVSGGVVTGLSAGSATVTATLRQTGIDWYDSCPVKTVTATLQVLSNSSSSGGWSDDWGDGTDIDLQL